jgi:hypothetical protein
LSSPLEVRTSLSGVLGEIWDLVFATQVGCEDQVPKFSVLHLVADGPEVLFELDEDLDDLGVEVRPA